MTLEAILFDLDGTLVDSEPLQFHAYRDAFAEFGVRLDIDAWNRWHAIEASITRFVRDEGLDVDPEAVRSRKRERYEAMIEHELELKPGARELVEACRGRFRLAIVSGSRIESIEACLARFDLRDGFECLVSSTTLKRAKPWPDPYLEALARLELTASRALAIEDSIPGMRAALDSGLACVVCPDGFSPDPRSAFDGAAALVASLRDLTAEALIHAHASGSPA